MDAARAAPADPQARQRAALRTLATRRRRVFRCVGLFTGVTTVMVLMSMTNRDTQNVARCRVNLEHARRVFQDLHDRGQESPSGLPLPQDSTALSRAHYHYNVLYANMLRSGRRVGVACCDQPHRLYLKGNGRHVLTFDGDRLELRWMLEPEFRAQAAGLRLPAPLTP